MVRQFRVIIQELVIGSQVLGTWVLNHIVIYYVLRKVLQIDFVDNLYQMLFYTNGTLLYTPTNIYRIDAISLD